MKIYEFDQPFYPFRLMACVGADAIRGLFELDLEPLDDNCLALTACRVTMKDKENAIILRFRDTDGIDFMNVVHECGHFGIDVFDYIDQPVCVDSSETFCYLIGWAGGCCEWLKAHLTCGKENAKYAGRVVFETNLP